MLIPENLFGLKVEVLRSRRKTAAIHIVGSELQVRVPHRIGDRKIVEILETKKRWVRNKAIQLRSQPLIREREFVTGEFFFLFGRRLNLKILEGGKVGTKLVDDNLITTVRASELGDLRKSRIKTYIEKWYLQEACKIIEEKVFRYSAIIGVSPRGIKVRNYKTRWGSCYKKGRLTFNFHLIKAPQTIIDYVVIHELCHIIQPNHSKLFWNEVAKYDPNYKNHKKWLNLNGAQLII